ncbi:Long chain acyl-CoA synthetase 7, peroxisomal [Auxenochlorella protothecoides]|uniref:Long-chain-fatty-acid--CoA ligase n=1 Tax=Auxenochlorella protothecoides TaxID=3075 RepID=A0A087SHC7_AUXPR|nr:Long chain acyl-CoA synthetase 7, peroxisomal [Auxenochlorella protothecoides]KFM25131.1 Long chain acyl-CoA synthetase 7, peroxisomal [Auxenochlorella protothecoides]
MSTFPPLDAQCVVLPEKLNAPGPWTVRRNANFPEALIDSFDGEESHVRTCYDLLEHSVVKYPDSPYLGTRSVDARGAPGPYAWLSYSQVGEARTQIGSGLAHLGVRPGSNVGLFSTNCADWVLVDAALHAYACVSVPLYDTLGADVVQFVNNHAELAAVACSAATLPALLETLPASPTVAVVVVYAAPAGFRMPATPPGSAARLVSLDRLRALGMKHPSPHVPPSPADTALINYTSGTTGMPKGVVLTHANIVASIAGQIRSTAVLATIDATERHISYLPLAHIFERVTYMSVTHRGGAIGFFRGDVLTLLEDIQALRPTYFPSVPRLWNRIYDRIMAQVAASSPVKRRLFETAYAYKKRHMAAGDMTGGPWAGFWNRLVFNKIKQAVGGEVRMMVSGASALSPEVFEFMRIVFDCVVIEGYGMTETTSGATISIPGDPVIGHVGIPTPACEVKLADVPEMGYTNADLPRPRGEICVRGPLRFKEYYKDPENTRETIDEEGWLHTGDIGTWLPGERLKIIDRKKNIFKLSQGEYVAPEKIENIYVRSPYVAQVFVHGDSLRSCIVGVVVPDPEVLLPWAKQRGLPQDLATLCEDEQVKAMIQKSLSEEARVAKLKGFEQVADIVLTPVPFSVETGTMTPTFKLKRPQLREAYAPALEAMYARLPM